MSLKKVVEIDKIEIVGEYSIQVRTATKVLDGGRKIGGTSYHRHVLSPDSDCSCEDAKVQKIANALFDDACKAAWVAQNTFEPDNYYDNKEELSNEEEEPSAGGGDSGGDASGESSGQDSGGVEGSSDNSASASDGESASSESSSDDSDESAGSSGSDASDDSEAGSGGDDSEGSESESSGGSGSIELPGGEPSDVWTKDQLKAYMDANSIEYNSGDTKNDLLAKISAAGE